jgi:hypothetical protein
LSVVEVELRQVPPDDPPPRPFGMRFEERGAHSGASRPQTQLVRLEDLERCARGRDVRTVLLDTNARLTEANRMYREAGYREVSEYNGNPRADRRYEKSVA